MQTADSNENLHLRVGDFAPTADSTTRPSPEAGGSAGIGDEENENHLNGKFQPLSWRRNGLFRNKEHHHAMANDEMLSVAGSSGSWRSGALHRDNYYGQSSLKSTNARDPSHHDMFEQDKKFTSRTFEKSSLTDMEDGGVGGMMHVEKGVLRTSNHNNRDVGRRNNQRHQLQQAQMQANNDKSKVTPLAHLLLSEDMRISKILRRLVGETNSAVAVDLCKKLEGAVRSPDNIPYICRSFEYLTESMITVLKQCPVQCSEQASTILGLIGYINRVDFPIYKDYITKEYQACKGIQKYLMMALKTTFSCDAVNLNLIVYSDRVLILLKDYLENADKAEIFVAVSETIAEFSKHYKRAFEKHFTDIVDIVVGWHLEVEQPQALKLHCSTVLQQLSQYFVQELDFTFGLLGQFLEDISSFGENAELSVGSFVGAFNSILKSLATKHEVIALYLGGATMQHAACIITRAALQSLAVTACEETVLNCNEFFCLIFTNGFNEFNVEEVVELIALEVHHFPHFTEQEVASLLFLILFMIRQLRANTPTTLVTMILKIEDNPLANLKLSQNDKNFKIFLKIYHEILMIKNVPLLQEAYRHIVRDVNVCIASLECGKSDSTYSIPQSECILNFYLSALAALATQTSSIIGMYALNPSILELLIVNCKAAKINLWLRHSTLHSALLQLLAVHCKKNHNYRISSSLLKELLFSKLSLDDSSSNSPTSENFTLILKFLAEIFDKCESIEKYNLNILLNWTKTLLEECKEHAEILDENENFVRICKAVCESAFQSPLESSDCLEVLLQYPVINCEVLRCVRDVAIYMLDSMNPTIREKYTILFSKLPLSISLDFSKAADSVIITQQISKTHELKQWYASTPNSAPLRDKYFKPYLDVISLSSSKESSSTRKLVSQYIRPIFSRCWTAQLRDNCAAYQKAAYANSKMLTSWMQFEAARYCVRSKLRTTIGKPQDTFLKIEAIIMQFARILAMKEGLDKESSDFENIVLVQSKARNLLHFLESLEKQIYNAAEGTAFAIPVAEKPAKTFFRVNASTCNEWFKRIRTAVDLIAIHSMEPEMVVRYTEVILKTLMKSDKYNELLMDHTIMSLVWALLRCGEADTLHGVYNWVKEKTGKRHVWIKYVAEQAAGHKEQAAEGYMHILNERDTKMDAYIKEFLTDQLFDCLYYTNQWTRLREVLKLSEGTKRETITLSCAQNQPQLDALEALYYRYANPESDGQVQKALDNLADWSSDGDANTPEKENFSYYKTLHKLETTCIASVIKRDDDSLPTNIGNALRCSLQECFQRTNSLNTRAPEHLVELVILNHVAQKLMDSSHTADSLATFDCSQIKPPSTVLLKCLRWSRLFEHRYNSEREMPAGNFSMFLDVAASSRREGNSKLCSSELERFFALKGFREPLVDISAKLMNHSLILDITDADLLRGFSELANCMYVNNTCQMQTEAINLASAYCSQIIEQVAQEPDLPYPETSAKMLLTLSEWLLQRGSGQTSLANSVELQKLLPNLADISDHHPDEKISEIIPSSDLIVGKLIQTSLLQDGNSGQAWCAFGNWCYRWGKKMVEAKTEGNSSQKAGLLQRDLDTISEILGGNNNESTLNEIVAILSNHQVNANDGDEDIDASEVSSTDLIESQLRKVSALSDKPAQTITSIIKIWRQAHRSFYTYYEMAAEAYFKYLCIENQGKAPKQNVRSEDSSLVTTTLRLLRLVVKYAFGLQEVLEEGLSTTPTRPWKVIIPQLFSRLNHHEPYVRKRVSELLCRVAEDKPHLIIFPAVVGAQQESKRAQPSDELNALRESEERTPLSNCFNSLLSTLSSQAPETVQQVQLLVKELKRVTLLWDEYWIHSLAQLYSEYSSLFNAFELEVKKSTDIHLDVLSSKHAILMRHVSADLRKIAAVTEKPAETNYERSFQERYNDFIQNTISELQNPLNVLKPNENWLKIKQLYSVFQQRALRTSASTLKMYDISPILASMRNTSISMPGVETVDKQPIFIKAIDSTVYILPTKTKPKKLAFFGSDGRKYTYLFKGLEDLHLDERIMQFLSISNSMMARCSDSENSSNCYRAHHYSVIPLGPQSGLISWVDGVTPLFALYKKWQQREALVKQQQKERPSALNSGLQQACPSAPTAVRPSELFYNKLTPLLAEQNIKITDARKHWPPATLRRVLEELTNETPHDLLAKELWCHATNAAEWRRSVRNYSLSVAVMSVIGYVIGLGDRHLDNVLVKLSSGEIVHIDYNVCFEKGKTLRVPEKVPFRMTPNLEEALGITGIEGTFRLGCEHVLKTLRKERETLLTLLEAFVYDPLVDWAVSDDGTTTSTRMTTALVAAADIATLKLTGGGAVDTDDGHRRTRHDDGLPKKHDADATRNTISIRFNEFKPFWLQYRDEVKSKLHEIVGQITSLEQNRKDLHLAEEERDSLTKQLAMIRELEMLGSAMGSHSLNTISQRYSAYKRAADEFNCIKQSVSKCHADLKASNRLYFDEILEAPRSSHVAHMRMQLFDYQQSTCANEFEVVRELLEQSAQDQLYSKSDFARKEMDNTLYQQARMAIECMESLMQYANVLQFYPRKRLLQNRLVMFSQWYGELLDEVRDGVSLREELQQIVESEMSLDELEQANAVQYTAAMEKVWIELNFDLHKSANFLGEQQQQMNLPVEAALGAIESFVLIDMEAHTNVLQLAMLETITKTNESFIMFEETSLNKNDDSFILDQQIDYIEMLLTMHQAVFRDLNHQNVTALKTLRSSLQSLHKLKTAFQISIPERIVCLFMKDNEAELQNSLNMICNNNGSQEAFRKTLANIHSPELLDLLAEIEELFDECGTQMNSLNEVVRDILHHMHDCRVKQFVLSIFCYDFDPSSEKYETIAKVFQTTRAHTEALQTNDLDLFYDARHMSYPVIDYINSLQNCYITGLTSLISFALENKLKQTVAMSVPSPDEATLMNARALCQNLFVSLQQNCTTKHLQMQVHDKTKLVEHYTLVASAHFWANERFFRESQLMYGHIVHKEKLLSSVQNTSQSLSVWKLTMSKIQSDIEENVAAIAQRLKWAVGANQSLFALQETFNSCVQIQTERYRFYLHFAQQLVEQSNVLLQFELLQSGNENTMDADRSFIVALTQWEESLSNMRQIGVMISPVEQSIVQLLDPEGKVDQCWINNISGLLDEMTFAVQRQLADYERTAQKIQENIYESGQQLQGLLDNQLRMDIRQLLKSIVKVDAATNQFSIEKTNALISTRVREFQHSQRQFYAQLSDLQMKIISRDFSESVLMQLHEQITSIQQTLSDNFVDLVDLVQSFIQNDFSSDSPARSVRSAAADSQSNSTSAVEKKAINQREQKRNAYAVSVWKRIRMKLEGRDPDPNRRCTVTEQVDFIIREATNPDNLALLYEGWTPWV